MTQPLSENTKYKCIREKDFEVFNQVTRKKQGKNKQLYSIILYSYTGSITIKLKVYHWLYIWSRYVCIGMYILKWYICCNKSSVINLC